MQSKPSTSSGRTPPLAEGQPDRLVVGKAVVLEVRDGRVFLRPRARVRAAA